MSTDGDGVAPSHSRVSLATVTAAMDEMAFLNPVHVGDIVRRRRR